MAHPKPLSETVTKMATETSVTLGWDVIVNYTEPDINRLLAQTFDDGSGEQIKSFEFKISIFDPLTGNYINIHYDFGLAAPLLKFNSRGALGPTCNLTFPVVNGTVQVEGGTSASVPSNRYSVVIGTLMLVTAEGYTDDATTPYHRPFVFNNRNQGCVIIDLATSKDLTVDVTPNPPPDPSFPLIDSYMPFIVASIKAQLLEEQKVRYEIARVKADPPPSGTIQLKPKSFRFNAFLPSESSGDKDVGVLTLFIQTRDENQGRQEDLATAWESQWRVTLGCSPIPEGQTASLIFSKHMIYESVIKPALVSQGFSGEQKLEETIGSLEMKINTGKRVQRDAVRDEKWGSGGSYIICTATAIDVTLDPLVLKLSENSGSATYTTSWEFGYSCLYKIISGSSHGSYTNSGTVTATHKMPKDPNNSRRIITFLDDYALFMDCSVSKDDWDVSFQSSNSHWADYLDQTGGVPIWMKGLEVELPSFDLRLGSFNFFWTTNLLFPGDKKVININKESGLHIPGDLYLVGNVVDE